MASVQINYAYGPGTIRNRPLSRELEAVYRQAAAAAGIDGITVVSGGQGGARRTGSTRHDHGGSGDIKLMRGGRVLSFENPEDLPYIRAFVSRAHQLGAQGIGAGRDYMGSETLHVGFGKPAVWGADGKGANAPAWLREAVGSSGAPIQPTRIAQDGSLTGGGGTDTLAGGPGADQVAAQSAQGAFKPANYDPRAGGSKHAYSPFDPATGMGAYKTSSGKVLGFDAQGNTIYGAPPPPQPAQEAARSLPEGALPGLEMPGIPLPRPRPLFGALGATQGSPFNFLRGLFGG